MNYRIDLAVIEQQTNYSRFGLTLHNLSDHDLHDWSIHVSFRRYIQPQTLTQGQIKQVGGYCVFTPPQGVTLQANNSYYVEFGTNTAPFQLLDDGFDDAFIQMVKDGITQTLNVVVTPIALSSSPKRRISLPVVTANLNGVIPAPQFIEAQTGYFNLETPITFQAHSSYAQSALVWLADELSQVTDFPIKKSSQGNVCFVTTPTLAEGEYKLEIQAQQILLEANSSSGFMYAATSLLQLISNQFDANSQQLPCTLIQDKPRFEHRGMMLDCARHFHTVEQVKRLINQLAKYKFNAFHWHLTDDEGWRVEIKALPQLTDIGAWRGLKTPIEPQYSHLSETYGGFYSQDQIREVIRYAAERNITVIPEIDIPGHCRAAIKSLPHLLVDAEDQSQYRSIQYYTDNVLSPALQGTYTFIDTVLEEIADLFPSPLVHIGGDEVPEGVWTQSPKCQALMASQGYTDPKELQGHLLRHAENKLKSLGKRMLGWEEVQHGDKVSKDTIICSWLSEDAGLHCASNGFDVILQPAQFTYLDIVQDHGAEEMGVDWAGVTPLEKSYSYEPLSQLDSHDPVRQHIFGIQCGLWCEIIDTPERMEYMLFPRLLAIAEACWTEKQNRNWQDFLARLHGHTPTLSRQGVKFKSLN
ncbi:beta-N-acetylhexosaminidase [Vibrio algicola]|uniref:beta-N-acetylhexosaminidase n=1 Tax=Vibrio algicola TaxID=2662262 RepID=A0A5Q0TI43_9VIBR|nr:family 20 glycosylhydrolase [Vibrio algicola]